MVVEHHLCVPIAKKNIKDNRILTNIKKNVKYYKDKNNWLNSINRKKHPVHVNFVKKYFPGMEISTDTCLFVNLIPKTNL